MKQINIFVVHNFGQFSPSQVENFYIYNTCAKHPQYLPMNIMPVLVINHYNYT